VVGLNQSEIESYFFLSDKQADDYFAALGCETHKEEFCHRRGVFFHRNRCTIGMACAQAVALRGTPTTARRHVPGPRRHEKARVWQPQVVQGTPSCSAN